MNDLVSAAVSDAKAAIAREDYDAAIRALRPIAEAQFLLGHLYFSGGGVPKAESREWLERAASQMYPDALYWLACLGDEYDFGPPVDPSRRSLLIRAAELGSSAAQRDLGCFYAIGEGGFPKDETLGRHWYGVAAEQGLPEAQYNYAFMILLGEGGPADRGKAYDWFRRAADAGDPDARRFLLENGD